MVNQDHRTDVVGVPVYQVARAVAAIPIRVPLEDQVRVAVVVRAVERTDNYK